ncbi:MAG: DUF924 family protein [Polyangiaceae bacterium]|nr:DUF924 family protein [Polyangiaceae bacterium]
MIPAEPSIIDFWTEAGPTRWFAKDEAFDAEFRARFLAAHEAATAAAPVDPTRDALGSLSLLLLLDQFPRNAFRGTPRMFATDGLALAVAHAAIDAGHDARGPAELRVFFYLPLEHAESLEEQRRCVALHEAMGVPELTRYAALHHDIIVKFGRFPHRNAVLGRASTAEELEFLAAGGFAG